MNYTWTKQIEKGQRAIGYIEIYTTNANGIHIKAIINYFPNLEQFAKNKVCHATVFFESEKQNITDGFFHWIYDDLLYLVSTQENVKFETGTNDFNMMITQTFITRKLPVFGYFTHGDYSKSEN